MLCSRGRSASEALALFRQWCPEARPEYWMVDCSWVEINAILSVFSKSKIALCDVHHERAWGRWTMWKENSVSDRASFLELLGKMANAWTEEELFEGGKVSIRLWWTAVKQKTLVDLRETWLQMKKWWVNHWRPGLLSWPTIELRCRWFAS